jgi:hypothetical protein
MYPVEDTAPGANDHGQSSLVGDTVWRQEAEASQLPARRSGAQGSLLAPLPANPSRPAAPGGSNDSKVGDARG